MADYLESYAARFELPVRTGVRVDGLSRNGDRYVVTSGDRRFQADNVVVAMAATRSRGCPVFAAELDPGIVQLHSGEYRNPSQLQDGGVLVVGAGNSGAEIALDVVARSRRRGCREGTRPRPGPHRDGVHGTSSYRWFRVVATTC